MSNPFKNRRLGLVCLCGLILLRTTAFAAEPEAVMIIGSTLNDNTIFFKLVLPPTTADGQTWEVHSSNRETAINSGSLSSSTSRAFFTLESDKSTAEKFVLIIFDASGFPILQVQQEKQASEKSNFALNAAISTAIAAGIGVVSFFIQQWLNRNQKRRDEISRLEQKMILFLQAYSTIAVPEKENLEIPDWMENTENPEWSILLTNDNYKKIIAKVKKIRESYLNKTIEYDAFKEQVLELLILL